MQTIKIMSYEMIVNNNYLYFLKNLIKIYIITCIVIEVNSKKKTINLTIKISLKSCI